WRGLLLALTRASDFLSLARRRQAKSWFPGQVKPAYVWGNKSAKNAATRNASASDLTKLYTRKAVWLFPTRRGRWKQSRNCDKLRNHRRGSVLCAGTACLTPSSDGGCESGGDAVPAARGRIFEKASRR
ncbi:hypothetical protein B0H11DRAFT_2380393, partial [Mycena galericulata]